MVTIDADGQHLPEEIAVLIGPSSPDEADNVNGSRLLGEFERESIIRHIGVHFFSRLVTILTSSASPTPPAATGPRAPTCCGSSSLEQDQFWTSEVLIEALASPRARRRGPRHDRGAQGRQVEEAEVAEVRLLLLEGHHPDLAPVMPGRT